MSDSEDESVDWRNPFAGRTSQLIDTAADFRWLIYRYLTKWDDIRNMALALGRKDLQDELCAGIHVIDFIDNRGSPIKTTPLTIQFKSWAIPNHVKAANRQVLAQRQADFMFAFQTFEKHRKKFTRLESIRCPWINPLCFEYKSWKDERSRIYEQVIYDPKVRFVNIRFLRLAGEKILIPHKIARAFRMELIQKRHKQTAQWIYDGLTVRIRQWNSQFCVVGDLADHWRMIWINGTLTIDPELLQILYNYISDNKLDGIPVERLVCNNERWTWESYYSKVIGDFTNFSIDRVLTNLTEVIFDMCGPRRYIIPIGSKVHTIKAVFSLSQFVVSPDVYFNWIWELYGSWGDIGFTYYQVTRFEIPLPQESLKRWQYLFPNVPPDSFQIITAEQITRFNILSQKVTDLHRLKSHYKTKRTFSQRKLRDGKTTQDKVTKIERQLTEVVEILQEIDELDRRSITLGDLDLAVDYLNSKGSGQWITRVNKLVDSFRAIRENKLRDTGISTERSNDEDVQ